MAKMFQQRYSHSEMDQWQTACTNANAQAFDTSRHTAARPATAKGHGERQTAHTVAYAMSSMQAQTPENWAGECLFDCYNS